MNPENEINSPVGPLRSDNAISGETSQRSVANESEQSPLGNTYKTTVPSVENRREATVLRFVLQAAARELLPYSRVQWCLRRFLPGRQVVDIVHAPDRQSAYYYGLIRCSKLWECPVCAAKITEQRRIELVELLDNQKLTIPLIPENKLLMLPRFHLAMLTFTLAHHAGESADTVLDRLQGSYSEFTRGRWFQGFKSTYFMRGYLRALEITHGASGWHPHFHVLLFLESQPTDETTMQMEHDARIRWMKVTRKHGGVADYTTGCQLDVGHYELYAAKLAGDKELRGWTLESEVMKQPVKHGRNGNRTMTDLLIAYVGGDIAAGVLWSEAVSALHGRQHLTPSNGLWKLLGRELKSEREQSEDETTANDRVLASLTWAQWSCVLRHDRRGEVLAVASGGDPDELWQYLMALGVRREGDDDDN